MSLSPEWFVFSSSAVRGAERADCGEGSWNALEGASSLDQVWRGCGGGDGSLGKASRGLLVLPQPAGAPSYHYPWQAPLTFYLGLLAPVMMRCYEWEIPKFHMARSEKCWDLFLWLETTHVLPFLCCCPAGAILLDLEQNSLPGIAHLVVETMIISDQIRAEDRPSVLRALLLKHRSCSLSLKKHICYIFDY